MWNENQEVPKKKRDPAKGKVLKDERPLPIIKLADDFARMNLEQIREKLIEEYPAISISKTQFYHIIKKKCALSIKKKLKKLVEYRNLDDILTNRKLLFVNG